MIVISFNIKIIFYYEKKEIFRQLLGDKNLLNYF